ncbi:MAG: hypothetical protein K8L99_13065, partial [Anaerolineae bacterium]|nr:hypothetical protein [Anaerolineae bacterium]
MSECKDFSRGLLIRLYNFTVHTNLPQVKSVDSLLVQMTGDFTAGMMLKNLIRWWPCARKEGGWIYKSAQDWMKDLGLTERMIGRVHRQHLLEAVGVKTAVMRANGSPTKHYVLNVETFVQKLAAFAGVAVDQVEALMQQECDIPVAIAIDLRTFEPSKTAEKHVEIQIDETSVSHPRNVDHQTAQTSVPHLQIVENGANQPISHPQNVDNGPLDFNNLPPELQHRYMMEVSEAARGYIEQRKRELDRETKRADSELRTRLVRAYMAFGLNPFDVDVDLETDDLKVCVTNDKYTLKPTNENQQIKKQEDKAIYSVEPYTAQPESEPRKRFFLFSYEQSVQKILKECNIHDEERQKLIARYGEAEFYAMIEEAQILWEAGQIGSPGAW